MAVPVRSGALAPYLKTPPQGIPVAADIRYDFRNGLIEAAVRTEIPPQLIAETALYGAGLYAAIQVAKRVADALPPCNFDLIGAVHA